jgi:tRNA nucleotidyltransferase (CCA-adding enzyme)
MKLSDIPPKVVKVAENLLRSGATTVCLVGGAVVDLVQGRQAKDWDLEVFGMEPEKLEKALSAYNPEAVGQAFGIHKLSSKTVDGWDVDVSVPRRDNKVGVKHTDFAVQFDPDMTVKEAARRRDFTVNTLAYDIGRKVIVDVWGGMDDLNNGVLRATDPELFVQDPLRALRAMQLGPRKRLKLHPDTRLLINCMATQETFDSLSRERVFEEWRKLSYARLPGEGLNILVDTQWIQFFPEIQALIGVEQHPEWHPEGDAFVHTKCVMNAYARLRDTVFDGIVGNRAPVPTEEEMLKLFLFAICHDFGKATTTVKGDDGIIRSHGHDEAGEEPTKTFLARMTNNGISEDVTSLVVLHHQLQQVTRDEATDKAWRRLVKRYGSKRLTMIAGWGSRMDWVGSALPGTRHILDPKDEHPISHRVWEKVPDIIDPHDKKGPAPLINGGDLIKAGMKPGPDFKVALEHAMLLQQQGETDKDALLRAALAEVGNA